MTISTQIYMVQQKVKEEPSRQNIKKTVEWQKTYLMFYVTRQDTKEDY